MNENFNKDIYFHYINTNSTSEFTVISIGHEKCSPKKPTLGPLQGEHFVIHYVLHGSGEFILDSKKYRIEKGDVFYAPASMLHSYKQDNSDPWEYIWFEFGGTKAKKLCSDVLLTKENPVYHCQNEAICTNLIEMLNVPSNPLAVELNSLSHIYRFFSQLAEDRCFTEGSYSSNKQYRIECATRFIESQYNNPNLNLTLLCSHLHLNPSYLSRIFKEVTGTPVSRYIIELRLHKASELLQKKTFTIKDIAYMVGYTDPHFFSKEFKKHRGINPSQFVNEGYYTKNNNHDKK